MVSTLVLWIPFLLRLHSVGYVPLKTAATMLDVYSHWDGPLYIIVAKTWYNLHHPLFTGTILGLSPSYFMAHFPLYPAFISAFAPLLGYLKSMLLIPVLFSVLYLCLFYTLLKKYHLTAQPLTLSVVAALFTPRFFVVRSVGAPETMFLFFMVASLYFFMDKKYWYAGILGALAVLTKSAGILLFIAYGLHALEQIAREKKFEWRWLWLSIMPLSLIGLFYFFYLQTGDFFAHFKSADNANLLLMPPFQVFNRTARWIGTGWLEDIMLLYMFYGVSLYYLYQKKIVRPLFYISTVFAVFIISVQHKDIARYSIPMLPGALIAFEKFFTSRAFVVVSLLLLPALYFYAWNFMLENRAPITDWAPFQ